MAAPALAVDWEAIKAHAITHGPREAARAFGISEGTVMARCAREGWLKQAGKAIIVQPLPSSMKPKASNASTPSDAARSTLEKLGQRSRLNALRTADKGFAHSSKLAGEEILAAAPSLASLGKLAQTAQAPGWQPAQSGSGGLIGLHVTVRPADDLVLDVAAEVTQVPAAE